MEKINQKINIIQKLKNRRVKSPSGGKEDESRKNNGRKKGKIVFEKGVDKNTISEVEDEISETFENFYKDQWIWHGTDGAGYRNAEPYLLSVRIQKGSFRAVFSFNDEAEWNDDRDSEEGWTKDLNDFELVKEKEEDGWEQVSWEAI